MGDPFDSLHNLPDRVPRSGTKIESSARPSLNKVLHRSDVSLREIGDVNVVANRRAIGGLIIVPEDLHGGPISGSEQQQRNQVSLRRVLLAKGTVRVGSACIEIP